MNDADFLRADWPAPASIVAGTTLRRGGFSAGPWESLNLGTHVGDDPDAVRSNRMALRDYLALPSEPIWLRQVHGDRVVEAPVCAREPEADACWTRAADSGCVVMTADCLPVLFCTTTGDAIGAAHAGWRGLCSGVLENTVAAMPAEPADILAWLGPAIAQPAFEVGGEVRQQFIERDAGAATLFRPNSRGRWQADLYGLARRRLAFAGVTSVFGGGRCTFAEPADFFSYRREGRCGRMATLIFRRGEPRIA